MNQLRAILVHIDFPNSEATHEDLLEFQELANSAGIEIITLISSKRLVPDSKFFIGSGKAEEIRIIVANQPTDVIIFNHDLSPAQERNLERFLRCRVLDRTGLILDIFAQRARSFEGRLQVELAQLQHLATRLVRGWSHLERQKGGIGLRGGPGETQLEVDRRLLRNRVKAIKNQLEKVRSQRYQGRRARQRAEIPIISLVGYTNAGKSTLFNKLTTENVYVADQLFATLDPTIRQITLPIVGKVILTDTVGFIRHLPHDLVEAFKATLEEICSADLLLHVIDINDQEWRTKVSAVNEVLTQISADKVPQLLVYNKIDLLNGIPEIIYDQNKVRAVKVSAANGEGLDLLVQTLQNLLAENLAVKEYFFQLQPEEGKLRAELYKIGTITNEIVHSDGKIGLYVKMKQREYNRLNSKI